MNGYLSPDVTPFYNSKAFKEFIARIYSGFERYAPINPENGTEEFIDDLQPDTNSHKYDITPTLLYMHMATTMFGSHTFKNLYRQLLLV